MLDSATRKPQHRARSQSLHTYTNHTAEHTQTKLIWYSHALTPRSLERERFTSRLLPVATCRVCMHRSVVIIIYIGYFRAGMIEW